ncbi:MAG: glycoside hydrolase family 92 protein [Clostridia bacterium]|nr:glycoside hydrolase family 92 protein [Clostridia bacterium]
MKKTDYCKLVDVFYGNGETDRFFDDGLASKWFYIKALCGNTTPHATLPFGKMSVGAYSGGYPTGYGLHYPNSCGGIKKLAKEPYVIGFSHLHQSGTGAIQYYYNYAIVSPFYGDIANFNEPKKLRSKQAKPGYYKAEIDDIVCELSVSNNVAVHKYTFEKNGGRIAIDFSNNGLCKEFGNSYFTEVSESEIEILNNNEIAFSGVFSGIRLHFFVSIESESASVKLFEKNVERSGVYAKNMLSPYGVVFDVIGDTAQLKVGYSTVSRALAIKSVREVAEKFENVVKKANDTWNEYLSVFSIKASEDIMQKFYSNLYHSLIKPTDMTGERVLGVDGECITDFATFWDQYKTVLPLIFLSYPKMGEKIVKGIVNISKTLGKIPCSFGLSNVFPCEEQAKMLAIFSLCDAYFMGVDGANVFDIEECIQRELDRDDYKDFIASGYFERFTHILDVSDACLSVANITNNEKLKDRLIDLSKYWINAYSSDGLMSNKSKYYEGDRYTYSFRLQSNMEDRVELAGGKEKFAVMLDNFFGFGGQSVKQITHLNAYDDIAQTQYHRFEGFNNECDMETPYAYIYADRHDRLCEIMHECINRSFGLGVSGLPGNNDSGGLSSLFVFNALGLFPKSGSGVFLIGSPQIDEASIKLSGGNTLRIIRERKSENEICVDKVFFNEKQLYVFKISMQEIMKGGVLRFIMKSK